MQQMKMFQLHFMSVLYESISSMLRDQRKQRKRRLPGLFLFLRLYVAVIMHIC